MFFKNLKLFIKNFLKKNYSLFYLIKYIYIIIYEFFNLKKYIENIFGFSNHKKIRLEFPLDHLLLNKETSLSTVSKINHRYIHRYLKNYSGISLSYVEKLLTVIKTIWVSPLNYDLVKKEIIEITRRKPSSSLPPQGWLSLYDLCFTFGLIDILTILRNKAVQSSFAEAEIKTNNISSVELAFRAAIDQSQFKFAKQLLDRLEKLIIDPNEFKNYKIYYLIQSGQYKPEEFENYSFFGKKNKNPSFQNLIEGKTIAVVGPAPDDGLTGEEIDSYDIVVRANYQGYGQFNNPEVYGSRTDVSYYSGFDSNQINKNKNYLFLNDLKACAFKEFKHPFQLKLLNDGIAHKMIRPKLIFNGASLNGLNIIYDLLHYFPSKIKVFKNNLFVSKNPYHKSYRKNHLDNIGSINGLVPNERLASHSNHDLLSHFNFLNNLSKTSNIIFDNKLEYTLQMNIEEYLENLKKTYVTTVVTNIQK